MKNKVHFWIGKSATILGIGLMIGFAGCHGGPPRLPGLPGLPGIHHGQLRQPESTVAVMVAVVPEDRDGVPRLSMSTTTAPLLE